MAADTGTRIDNRYEVLGELGRGGMGIVYKATDLKMDRLVAIKVTTHHGSGRDDYQERFLREAKAIAKMQHPNIVVVFDYGYHNGAPYMAMEYVEGVPLDKVISSRVNLTSLAKVDYIVQVLNALHYAHEHGIVHRDVKPGNIMVVDRGKRAKLLDFGIARAGNATDLSKSGMAMGTTCYMSPEQIKGQKDLDGRADIFSAGVVLYELLAGKPPWTAEGDYEIMHKVIHDPFPPIAALNDHSGFERIFNRALAKEPGARYATADEMAQDLIELEAPLKEQVLGEARVQFENGDLLGANELVSQVLRIDTRHVEAIELRGKLQKLAQLQERSERVRQLRAAAEEAVGQKRYSEALAAVEQAITIDPANTELFHYRQLLQHEVKRREDIRKKLELARRAQEINDLSTAQELVDKALEADATDTQARMMKATLERERKQQQQQEMAEEAARALTIRALPRARDLIQQLETLDSSFARLATLKQTLLKAEAEEKRRAEIEAAVLDIRRTLESGDLSQCLSLAEQAVARFPDEARLVQLRAKIQALNATAERDRTVQEHIARINSLTEKGQNAEALAAAEKAVKQLGFDYRLQTLLAQVRQTVERERLLQGALTQARSAMQAADFDSALKILRAARTDFPNSREIAEAFEAAQTANTAKAAELSAETGKREIVEELKRALSNESDPEAQVRLAEEAVQRIPGNDAAEQVLARVRERQRQIAAAVDRAQEFQRTQHPADALREWERVSQLWPQHPQAAAQIARLTEAGNAPAPTQAAASSIETAAPKEAAASTPTMGPKTAPAPKKAASPMPSPTPMVAAVPALERGPEAQPPAPVPNFSATSIMAAMPAAAPPPPAKNAPSASAKAAEGAAAKAPLPTASPVARPVARPRPAPASSSKTIAINDVFKKVIEKISAPGQMRWLLVSLAALLVVVSVLSLYSVRRSRAARAQAMNVRVELHANVTDAKFKLDGQAIDSGKISLKPGREYVIEASREGYETDSKKITPASASASSPASASSSASVTTAGRIEFTLAPLAPKLSVSSDLKNGKVSLNDQEPVALQSGELGPEELAFGGTSLKVWDGRRLLLTLPLDAQPGKPVALSGALQAKDCSAAVISVFGSSARVYATPDLKGSSGAQPAQAIPPEGQTVDASAGSADFALSDGRSWTLQPASAPTLIISVSTSGETGTLQIQANVPEAQLKIDGKLRKDPMLNGSKTVLLKTGSHEVQVVAPDFGESEKRKVEIVKGKTVKEVFALAAVQGQLNLSNVEPSAAVYIDGEQRGSTSESGSLKLDISPGEHKIFLRKKEHEDSPTIARMFKPGRPETISGKELPLAKYGSLTLNVSPASAAITIRRGNEQARTVSANQTISLKPGTYTWVAEAEHFRALSETITIEPGAVTAVSRSLQPAVTPELGATDIFENPSLWSRHGDWWVFNPSEYGWLKFHGGSFHMVAEKKRAGPFGGKKKLEWTLDYRGDSDKIVYSASGNTLTRQVIHGGKAESAPVKSQFKEKPNTYDFIFDVSPARIIVRDDSGNPIDQVERSDSGVELGKIGLRGDISVNVRKLQ